MSKKKTVTSKEKGRFSNRRLILLSIIIALIIIVGFTFSFMLLQTPIKFSLKAAIIDQIEYQSNSEFVENATSILTSAGFSVTYYESKDVNVTFFSGLAKGNYGIIILRVHSAKRVDNTTVDFFTSEEFSLSKYPQMIDQGLLTEGSYDWEPDKHYFAITSRFIESLEGQFPKSVVVAMGCWSLKEGLEGMADAFRKKGAEVYFGWTEEVGVDHTDNETVRLLRMLLIDNKTVADAVRGIIPDWTFGSEMKYYPQTDSVGNLRISDLIADARASISTQSVSTLFEPVSLVSVTLFSLEVRKKFRSGLSATSSV